MYKVLLTDDAAFMRMMLKGILQPLGYECIEASNGKEMLTKVAEQKPDIITLDITMPEMDGLEALKALRASGNDTCVIMCSAMGQQAMVLDAIKSGASDFIVKPFDAKRVEEALKKAVARIA